MRNALAHVPRRKHQMVAALICTVSVQEAQAQWHKNAGTLRERFELLAELTDEAEDDVPAFMGLPKEHWPQLASTNSRERLNTAVTVSDGFLQTATMYEAAIGMVAPNANLSIVESEYTRAGQLWWDSTQYSD